MKFRMKDAGIHFFDRLAIYFHPYMLEVNTEYWVGHRRRKILTIGRFTFWVRTER